MNWYATAKLIHVTCVGLSIAGFVTRFALAMQGSRLLLHPVARVAPHVVDTILLGAAIAMVGLARWNPLSAPWLSAKIAGLVAYILLGMIAMRRGRPRAVRAAALIGAVMTFAYVVSVALTKSALGPAAWLGH